MSLSISDYINYGFESNLNVKLKFVSGTTAVWLVKL